MISMPTATSGTLDRSEDECIALLDARHRRARYPHLLAAAGLRAGTRLRLHRLILTRACGIWWARSPTVSSSCSLARTGCLSPVPGRPRTPFVATL